MKRIVKGILYPFFETGCEGTMWTLLEDGKAGYEAVHFIEEGDHLKIYGEKNEVLFEGIIACDHESGWAEYPLNPGSGQPAALGYWIHWTQRGWKPDDWAKLFFHPYLENNKNKNPLRAELVPRKK